MSDCRHQTEQENLIELFHYIDTNDNKLISYDELNNFLNSELSKRLTRLQYKILHRKVEKMKSTDFMNLEDFETLLTSPSTRDTLWEKFVVILGDFTTPASRKLEVRSYTDAYTCCPPAFFLILICIIQTVVFALFENDYKLFQDLEYYGRLRYQLYRYISYIFVHNNATHLAGNIILQLFCVPCEIVDHWRVWIIYITGAIFGSASYYIVCPDGHLIGASAAVYSLLAINIAELIMNWSEMPLRYLRLALYGSYIIIHLTLAVFDIIENDIHEAIVTEIAHIGGLTCGILLGLIMVKNLIIEKHEIIIKSICTILFIFISVILLCLNFYNLYDI